MSDPQLKFQVDVNDISSDRLLEILAWCRTNTPNFKFDYYDWDPMLDTWWTFDNSSDAVLFKLTWG